METKHKNLQFTQENDDELVVSGGFVEMLKHTRMESEGNLVSWFVFVPLNLSCSDITSGLCHFLQCFLVTPA